MEVDDGAGAEPPPVAPHRERSGVRPETRCVERRDVSAPLVGRIELRGKPVRVGALPDEVVARFGGRPRAHPRHALLVEGERRVEEHEALRPLREAQRQILHDGPTEITAAEHDSIEAEVIVHEHVKVATVCGYVVEAWGDVAVAEPPEVGDDDVEARFGERRDDLPVDALGLRPTVDEEQRHSAHALAHVGLPEASR